MIRNLTGSIKGLYLNNKEGIRAYLNSVIVYEKTSSNYLRFTANTSSTIGLSCISTNQTVLQYSLNGTNWSDMTTATSITLNSGESMYVRGVLSADNDSQNYTQFTISGDVKASGNINTLWINPNVSLYTLYEYCGFRLFKDCTGLTDARDLALPATTLAAYCYSQMFSGCKSLTIAPVLPATTLATGCYSSMFSSCLRLTTAPSLPATNLERGCYMLMFLGCGLTSAPALPATTLAKNCYSAMFLGCTSLTIAPELPATTLVQGCYNQIFEDCTHLIIVKCLATDISATDCTKDWMKGIYTTGTFIKAPLMTNWTIGDSGIPWAWVKNNCITFTAIADSTIGLASLSTNHTLRYSHSLISHPWSTMTINTTISLLAGETVYIHGVLVGNNSTSNYTKFTINGDVAVSGNINTLWDYQTPDNPLLQYCGHNLFRDCAGLTDVGGLTIPSTTLATACYRSMFENCTALTIAPALPATTLANDCYRGMFYGCSGLTSAPELPAAQLRNRSYFYMFCGCILINYIKCLATNISATNAVGNWLENVAATGTFVKDPSMTSWPVGVSGVPNGWTVIDA